MLVKKYIYIWGNLKKIFPLANNNYSNIQL